MSHPEGILESIRNIPPVTRFFTVTTVLVCFAIRMQITSVGTLMCSLPRVAETLSYEIGIMKQTNVFGKLASVVRLVLQCYQFFTTFLVPAGMISKNPMAAIIDIYFFYTFANHLESYQGKFRRNFPDCLWFTLLTGTIIVLLSLTYCAVIDRDHFAIHHEMMLSCVTYLWSRSSKNSTINFMGLFPIKAYYLPLFNLFTKVLLEGYRGFLDSFIGILGGYLYQCIQSDTLPIYNLFPGSYSSYLTSNANSSGRRVGTSNGVHTIHSDASDEYFYDSIFDKGYLKAPLTLYKLLAYRTDNSTRTTAFTSGASTPFRGSTGRGFSGATGAAAKAAGAAAAEKQDEDEATSSGYSWFSMDSGSKFHGKGRRLGDVS